MGQLTSLARNSTLSTLKTHCSNNHRLTGQLNLLVRNSLISSSQHTLSDTIDNGLNYVHQIMPVAVEAV